MTRSKWNKKTAQHWGHYCICVGGGEKGEVACTSEDFWDCLMLRHPYFVRFCTSTVRLRACYESTARDFKLHHRNRINTNYRLMLCSSISIMCYHYKLPHPHTHTPYNINLLWIFCVRTIDLYSASTFPNCVLRPTRLKDIGISYQKKYDKLTSCRRLNCTKLCA